MKIDLLSYNLFIICEPIWTNTDMEIIVWFW